MIAQPFTAPAPTDLPGHAAWQARKQLAFYLDLAFAKRDDVFLFHGLRLEHGGDAVRIDHVVLHRFGVTLIESGSVTGDLTLGPGGRLTRALPGASPETVPPPVERVRRQAQTLFDLLNAHRDELRRSKPFGDERFTVLVAIADRAAVRYEDTPPPEFRRADQINEAVHAHLHRQLGHRGFSPFVRFMKAARTETDAVRPFGGSELRALHGFLLAYHRALPSGANAG